MEEISPFFLDTEKTKPSFESEVAKWYLLKMGKHYACWRWDSKKDSSFKKYLVTDLKGERILRDTHMLEDVLICFDALEATEGK